MNNIALALTLFIACLHASAQADAWDKVLQQAHLTREQVHFDPLDQAQFGGGDFQIPYFKPLHEDPLRIPAYVRIFRELTLSQAAKPTDLTISTLAKIGLGVRRNLGRDPLANIDKIAQTKGSLLQAFQLIHELGKQPLTTVQANDLKSKLKTVPEELTPIITYLLLAEASSYEWRQKALAPILKQGLLEKAFAERTAPPSNTEGDSASPLLRQLGKEVDMPWLMVGGIDLVYAVEKAVARLKALKPIGQFAFDWETPLGHVAIHGAQNDTYADRAYLLILDTGGDDIYHGGGGSYDFKHPVSVLIDMQGNDQYLALGDERKQTKIHPRFGAGVFGYGILVDMGGDDIYRAGRQTLGRGDFGLGLLWDLGGNDRYECYVQCEGSAQFGGGILIDSSGDDHYTAFQQAQGFGATLGAGLLLDAGEGADIYLANDTQIDFPALVDAKHNTSFAQGAALGLRADLVDGHSFAGGFGALIDGGGNNTFTAGFFAQGVAYWYGVGILSVGTGNDKYEAGKYAEGAGVHFGVGVLHDSGGNDSYKVSQELGLGEGHDFGVGFFMDDAGDDTYYAPGLSLGCGSGNGIGIFWDRAGNDKYITKDAEVLGCASYRIDGVSTRQHSPTLGVFLDTGGKNEFDTQLTTPKGKITSGSWKHPGVGFDRASDYLLGVGLVVDSPTTPDPK